MSVPRLYVPAMTAGAAHATLPGDEANHAMRVLRLSAGAPVRIFDGKGREWSGRIDPESRRGRVIVAIENEVPAQAESVVQVTLGVAVLKGDQMDAVVRDATALGVAAIAPMHTVHVAVPPRAWQSGAALERWRRVAVAAAKQCGRAVVPHVHPVAPLSGVVASRADTTWLCVEPALVADGPQSNESPGTSALVLVGPEGGWTAQEVELVREAGGRLLRLGPRKLRAELAPIVALSSLWTKWGW